MSHVQPSTTSTETDIFFTLYSLDLYYVYTVYTMYTMCVFKQCWLYVSCPKRPIRILCVLLRSPQYPKAFTVSMIQDTTADTTEDTTAQPSLKQVLLNNFKLMTAAEINYVCQTLHLNHMTYQGFKKMFVTDRTMMRALKDDLHEFLIDDDRFVRTAFTKFQIFLNTQ